MIRNERAVTLKGHSLLACGEECMVMVKRLTSLFCELLEIEVSLHETLSNDRASTAIQANSTVTSHTITSL